MYASVDRPVTSLGPDDRRLLDAMRAWVHALTLAGDPGSAVAGRFEEDRGHAFDAMMRALDRDSTQTLTFQRPCHATVEEDEAVMLALWQLIRDDRLPDALATARHLVAAAAAPGLVRAMAAAERAAG